MKKIFTEENKNSLITELKRLEDFAIASGDDKILDIYFPHTIYEIACILDTAIGKEVKYGDKNNDSIGKKIN